MNAGTKETGQMKKYKLKVTWDKDLEKIAEAHKIDKIYTPTMFYSHSRRKVLHIVWFYYKILEYKKQIDWMGGC